MTKKRVTRGNPTGSMARAMAFSRTRAKVDGLRTREDGTTMAVGQTMAKARATTASPTTARATKGNPRGNKRARTSPRIPMRAVSVVNQVIGATSVG